MKIMKKKLLSFFLICLFWGCSESSTTAIQETTEIDLNKVYKWNMVTTWPKNYPGLGRAAENLSKYVDEMSNGRLKIKVYGAGEMVPAMEVFDAVSRGAAQLGHGASYYWTGKLKSSQFFTAVPFGLTAQEINSWIHWGGGQELWEEAYAPFNLIPFAGGNTGVQMAGWFKKEINSLDDLKGLKKIGRASCRERV